MHQNVFSRKCYHAENIVLVNTFKKVSEFSSAAQDSTLWDITLVLVFIPDSWICTSSTSFVLSVNASPHSTDCLSRFSTTSVMLTKSLGTCCWMFLSMAM